MGKVEKQKRGFDMPRVPADTTGKLHSWKSAEELGLEGVGRGEWCEHCGRRKGAANSDARSCWSQAEQWSAHEKWRMKLEARVRRKLED